MGVDTAPVPFTETVPLDARPRRAGRPTAPPTPSPVQRKATAAADGVAIAATAYAADEAGEVARAAPEPARASWETAVLAIPTRPRSLLRLVARPAHIRPVPAACVASMRLIVATPGLLVMAAEVPEMTRWAYPSEPGTLRRERPLL